MFQRNLFWPLFALVLGFALGGSVIWAQQAGPNYQDPPAQTERQNAGPTHPNGTAREDNSLGQKKRWYSTFLDHTPDWFVAIFTGLLAVVTLLLVRSTNKLWDAGERQLRLTRVVAIVQARNTRRQLRLTQSAVERQLQAYLSFRKIRINDVEAGKRASVTIPIENCGQTPAYQLSAQFSIGYWYFPLSKGTKIHHPRTTDEISQFILSPGMRARINTMLKEPLTRVEFDAIVGKSGALYVIGWVRFTDAFDRKWIQHLRLMYNWRGLESGMRSLEVCEEGNYIEQEGGPAQGFSVDK